MRILTLSCEYPPIGGGGAQVVRGLSRHLVQLGHEVDVVTMGYGDLPARETTDGVRVHRVPCLRARPGRARRHELASYVLRAYPVIRDLVRRRDYDLSHTHSIFPDGVLARTLHNASGLPYLITAHGADVPGYNRHRSRMMRGLLRPLWHAVVGQAETVVSPSRSLQTLVHRASASCRTAVIPFGADTTDLKADRTKHDRILVVGRLFEQDGVQYLLRAADGLPEGHTVHVVGDGPYRPTLERLGRECDTPVVFHGWLDRASPKLTILYETSRIFVLPSDQEEFPAVLLEAMAAGDAIVATASAGRIEVVGDSGILVAPRNEGALHRVLDGLVRDPDRCARLGSSARRRAREHFAWNVVATRYAELYRTVAHLSQPEDPTPAPTRRPAIAAGVR